MALLEDGLRDARMVSVAYGHLADNPLMFPDLDTSAGRTEDSSRAQEVQEKHWRPSSTDFLCKSKNDIQYVRIRLGRLCQCFFLVLAPVALSCLWSETVCAVPEALRSRAFGRDARESHSKMGLKVCKVAVQWICRFEQTPKKRMLRGTTGMLKQLDLGHFSSSTHSHLCGSMALTEGSEGLRVSVCHVRLSFAKPSRFFFRCSGFVACVRVFSFLIALFSLVSFPCVIFVWEHVVGLFAECTPRRTLYGDALGCLWARGFDILHSQMSATWLLPAHMVVLDRNRRVVVVTVRGTHSLEDVITDLGVESPSLQAALLIVACFLAQKTS